MKKPQELDGQFLALLSALRDGAVLKELDATLAELGQAIGNTHRPGELSLKLRFDPAQKSDGHMLLVAETITLKAPRLPKRSTLVFNAEGQISREDPAQITIAEVLTPVTVDRPNLQPVPRPVAVPGA